MEHKTIIDKDGLMVDKCVRFVDGKPQYFIMQEGQSSVTFCNENFVKPKWNGTEWIETATDEEIKVWEEKRKNSIGLIDIAAQ